MRTKAEMHDRGWEWATENKCGLDERHDDCVYSREEMAAAYAAGLAETHSMLVEEPYACVLADPPWPERGGGKIKRGADRHYDVVKKSQCPWKIIDIMLRSGVWDIADNAHLWLWTTNNYLKDGLDVMEACGFRYVTNAVWAKDRFGLGQYLRGQHELLLFGVRGRLPSASKKISSLIGQTLVPKGEHSRKPDVVYDMIEEISPGPYLEMFARRGRPGWDSWGNEAPVGVDGAEEPTETEDEDEPA